MKYVFIVIALLFGILHCIAGVSQLSKGKRSLTHPAMIVGSLLTVASSVFCIISNHSDWILAIAGTVIICICALRNGQLQGKVNPLHHIIRGLIAIIIIVGFAIY